MTSNRQKPKPSSPRESLARLEARTVECTGLSLDGTGLGVELARSSLGGEVPPPPAAPPGLAPAPAGPRDVDVPAAAGAVLEVLGFPFRTLLALPLPSALVCRVRRSGLRLGLRTSGAAPSPPDGAAFVGPELLALALAAEQGRAPSATVEGWCARKQSQPGWRLTTQESLAGLANAATVAELGWSTEQVLSASGLELVEVLL